MNQKEADLIAKVYCMDFFKIPTPSVSFATAQELGFRVDGQYNTRTREIWIRRNPSNYTFRFTLAHELAHAWQLYHGKPLDEGEADLLAMECTGLEC